MLRPGSEQRLHLRSDSSEVRLSEPRKLHQPQVHQSDRTDLGEVRLWLLRVLIRHIAAYFHESSLISKPRDSGLGCCYYKPETEVQHSEVIQRHRQDLSDCVPIV